MLIASKKAKCFHMINSQKTGLSWTTTANARVNHHVSWVLQMWILGKSLLILIPRKNGLIKKEMNWLSLSNIGLLRMRQKESCLRGGSKILDGTIGHNSCQWRSLSSLLLLSVKSKSLLIQPRDLNGTKKTLHSGQFDLISSLYS